MEEKLKSIGPELSEEFSKAFNENKAYVIASRAAVNNGLMEAAEDYTAVRRLNEGFTIDLKPKQGKITNQKTSGRCWIFSALNTFRFEVMKKLKLKDFELS